MAIKKTTTRKSTPTKKSSSIGISILGGNNKAEMKKWEIESAMNTLKRAEEIKTNSKMMTDIKKLANEQVKMLNKFTSNLK